MSKYKTATLTVTLYDGSKKQLKFYGNTQAEADEKKKKAKWEYDNGLLTFSSKTLVSKWIDEWQEVYARPTMSTSDYRQTATILKNYFIPYLGSLRLSDVRPVHIQKCASAISDMSASHIKKSQSAITKVFKTALDNKLITCDPTNGIVWSRGTFGERRALTQAERELFEKIMSEHPKGVLFALMYGCGLRPSEARALVWSNIDLAVAQLRITQAVKKSTKKIGPPKSKAGTRVLPIPPWLVSMLEKTPKTGLYIISNTKGNFLDDTKYRNAWNSFKRLMYLETGVPTYRNKIDPILASMSSIHDITPYYLRHTYATMLAENGVDMKTAQYLLGHSSIEMTAKIYTHVTPTMVNTAKDTINKMFDKHNQSGYSKDIASIQPAK